MTSVLQSPMSEEQWTPGCSTDVSPFRGEEQWEDVAACDTSGAPGSAHHHRFPNTQREEPAQLRPHSSLSSLSSIMHGIDPAPRAPAGMASSSPHGLTRVNSNAEVSLPQWMVEEAARLTPCSPDDDEQEERVAYSNVNNVSLESGCTIPNASASHSSSMDTPTKVLDFLPDLHPTEADPLSDLQEEEIDGRSAIASQISSSRRFVYSMLESNSSLEAVRALVPFRLWDSDIARVALTYAVARAEVAVVEFIVQSAFRAYHSCKVPEARPLPRVLAEVGASSIADADSFIELAAELLPGENDAEKRERRAEIFRLLITAPEMCCSPQDVAVMRRTAHVLPADHSLNYWVQHAGFIACTQYGCARMPALPPQPSEPLLYPSVACWTPTTHQHYPQVFQRRVTTTTLVLDRLGVNRSDMVNVLSYVDYTQIARYVDVQHPTRLLVVDQVFGNVEVFDASPVVMQKCAKRTRGVLPGAGMRVAATMMDLKGTFSLTGHLVGFLDNALYWRPSGSLGCEQLPPSFHLNPLATQNNPTASAGDSWFCGMCLLVNSMRLRKCRRCCNTHQGSLALETQRRRQHVQNSRGGGGGGGGGGHQGHNGGGGGGVHQAQHHREHREHHVPAMHSVNEVNLPYMRQQQQQQPQPPQQQQQQEHFETSDFALGVFGVRSGEVVTAGGFTGIVVGIGQDDALYWREGGDSGMHFLVI